MKNNKCLLLSHVWIKEGQEYKKDIVDLCVRHFRENNEDVYLILSGHGDPIDPETAVLCDKVFWTSLDPSEVGKGHPKSVLSGLEHASEKGFTRVLKQRADCIIAQKDCFGYYDGLMGDGRFLTDNEIGPKTHPIGDLLMYGDIDIFLNGWNPSLWHKELDGVMNFNNTLSKDKFRDVRFKSISELKWVYLDAYWEEIISHNMEQDILDNNFHFGHFLWGKYSQRGQKYL